MRHVVAVKVLTRKCSNANQPRSLWSGLGVKGSAPASVDLSNPTKPPSARIQPESDSCNEGRSSCTSVCREKKKKKRWSDRNVLQRHLCSMINTITLWLKGNCRLEHSADETFADGHPAIDCLHYEKVREGALMRPVMVMMPWHLFF